jgi:hypothetical protein
MILLVLELCVLLLLFSQHHWQLPLVNFTLIRVLPLARRTPPPPPPKPPNRLKDITKLTEYVIHIHTTLTATAKNLLSHQSDRIDRIWLFLRIAKLHTPQLVI